MLGSELPAIDDPSGLTIDGQKAKITVSGNDSVRVLDVGRGAKLAIANLTVAHGSADFAGGIYNGGGTATLRNTIVANSPSGGNCAGTIADGGYNIEDGTSCAFSEANDSMPSTEPLLADGLANNGGPTKTIALLEGGPAINAIPEAENGCGTEIKTDQRGAKRPRGSGCDVGAFEGKQRRR